MLVFGDGATQVFTADARTTYVEQRRTPGEVSVMGGGKRSSFWPPDYLSTHTLRLMRASLVELGQADQGVVDADAWSTDE
jgi:hypothetical protein